MIRRFAVLSLSALALAVMAAPAGAAAPELRGVVSGSPYGASQGYIAVPVLYSKMTARRVGLKSPVGLMVLKRTARVKVNGAPSTLPVGLRVGDRFKGVAEVSALNKRIFYPRITFDTPPSVYFRSKELSLSELTRLIQQLQANLGALSKFTLDTFGMVATQLAGLQKQINDLKALLDGLRTVDLSGLQSQIDGLQQRIDDLLASLANYALKSDLTGLASLTTVNSLISPLLAVTDLDDQLSALLGVSLTDLATVATLSDVTGAVSGLLATTDLDDQLSALLGVPLADLATVATTGDVNAAITAIGLPANIGDLALESEVPGLIPTSYIQTSELESELEALIAGTDIAGLATDTELSALQTQVNNLRTDLTTVCTAVDGASVTVDADGGGPLAPVTVPLDLGTSVTSVCPPPGP